MTITLRSVKGSALTSDEVDGNFTDLDTRVQGLENDSSLQGESVGSITLNGSSITFYGTSYTNFGAVDLSDAIDDAGLLFKLMLG